MKELFFQNWKAKLTSLLIAVSIWYVIKTNLDRKLRGNYPIPGTGTVPTAPAISPVPLLEDIIPNPLAPPPVPGSSKGG